jgi:ubiquinone/menaquinone biosynthesis C-methylase UbiE
MEIQWDYTRLADAYLKRPDYSPKAVASLISLSGAQSGDPVCDMGAGAGHLTQFLTEAGFAVTAVEPNDAMRANGIKRTDGYGQISWIKAAAEKTGLPDSAFVMVTFGSSFNVTDRPAALAETARILRPGGTFACMWNHRDLDDAIQAGIESVIKRVVPEYRYGSRREDQTGVINDSGLFGEVTRIEGDVTHEQSIDDCVEAWRSHATLERQTGDKFRLVLHEIEAYLRGLGRDSILIPYRTRIWAAKKA